MLPTCGRKSADSSQQKSKKSVGSYDRPNLNPTKYLTDNKFGLLIDLRSIAVTTMHGSGQRLVNKKDGVQL